MEEKSSIKPVEIDLVDEKTPSQTTSKQPKKLKTFIIVITVISILLFTGIGFTYWKTSRKQIASILPPIPSRPSQQPIQNTETQIGKTPLSNSIPTTPIFSGKLTKLTEDLNLTPAFKSNYYSAGTYLSGPYKGYTRYIAISPPLGPGGPGIYILASLDKKSFVVDGNPEDLKKYNQSNSFYPLSNLDTKKVTKVDHLPAEAIKTIPLTSPFALSENILAVYMHKTGTKDSDGNDATESLIQTDLSSFTSIHTDYKILSFYTTHDLFNPSREFFETITEPTPTPFPYTNFIAGTTQILITDSTGLPYLYDLATTKNINDYSVLISAYEKEIAHPVANVYPDHPYSPGTKLLKNDITTSSALYNTYNIALPGACSTDANTLIVKNLTDTDFEKIGTSLNGDIYVLKNKNHPILQQEYKVKVSEMDLKSFNEINHVDPPTYNNYVAKNPLIFFQDPWKRWVMLGEFDFKLAGGCGKPVVYLYPPEPTDVSVQFVKPLSFNLTIPTYHNGWNVKAYPDGTLTDLQPQFTDCSKIDSTKLGSEYAASSCKNNSYPYLYWAGQSYNTTYPVVTKGWFVTKENLQTFLSQKLDEIGFNNNEKSDFLSYWIPTLQKKNASYFRISFLQNDDMDKIAPMQVTPNPTVYYRYFLDYSMINSKPTTAIQPQNLTKIARRGFTLVEWGGLKR